MLHPGQFILNIYICIYIYIYKNYIVGNHLPLHALVTLSVVKLTNILVDRLEESNFFLVLIKILRDRI